MSKNETIIAISTANGNAAIGVIRVSGPEVPNILKAYFPKTKPRFARYTKIKDGHGNIIDDAIVIFFESPASYTGEDMLEIHMHGNHKLLETFQNILCEKYTRLATPGEFTERAFLNNKIDLVQAEAVMDIVNSSSINTSIAAQRSLQGKFSEQIVDIKNELLSLRVTLESSINFPEDETPDLLYEQTNKILLGLIEKMKTIITRVKYGLKLTNNKSISILGKPNVGKSSLSNCLLGENCSIVSDSPGTTRDLLKNDFAVGGNVVTLFDTAGLRKSRDKIESKGIELSKKASQNSDLVLYLVDDTQGLDDVDKNFIEEQHAECWIIRNKIDLSDSKPKIQTDTTHKTFYISITQNLGLDLLVNELSNITNLPIDANITTARERHVDLVRDSLKHLYNSKEYNDNHQIDLAAEELRLSHLSLENILGGNVTEDLLDKIFSDFCIGK